MNTKTSTDQAIRHAYLVRQQKIMDVLPNKNPLLLAIVRAGGVSALAREMTLLGARTSRQQIYRWKERGYVPAERAAVIEQITGVPKARLRPDLWRAV